MKGVLGKGASFFHPNESNKTTSIETFAYLGALAGLFSFIPHTLSTSLMNKSLFLNDPPALKKALSDANYLLIDLAALTIAARRLGMPPLGVAVVSTMVIPTIDYAFETISLLVNKAAKEENDLLTTDKDDCSSEDDSMEERYPTVEEDDYRPHRLM